MGLDNVSVIERRANPEIVEAFERLLGMARNGEIIGYVMSYELTGAKIGSVSSFNDGILLIGHLTRQIALVNRALDEGASV